MTIPSEEINHRARKSFLWYTVRTCHCRGNGRPGADPMSEWPSFVQVTDMEYVLPSGNVVLSATRMAPNGS